MAYTKEEYEAKIAAANAEIEQLEEAMRPYKHRLKMVQGRVEKINRQWRYQNSKRLDYVLFDIHAYDDMRKFTPPKQFYNSGYWPEEEGLPNENAIKVMIGYKAEILPATIEFINQWVQVSKHKKLDIFRHDLSARGSWNLKQDGTEWIVFDARSYEWKYRSNEEYRGTLEGALEYVALYHWYGEGPDEDDFMGSHDD